MQPTTPEIPNNEVLKSELYTFIKEASEKTFAGNAQPLTGPERPGFIEFIYNDPAKNLHYRDSFVGDKRSRGMEVVRKDGKPIWCSQYGGGMVEEFADLSHDTFEFLKKALSSKDVDKNHKQSFRGPLELKDADWKYEYDQSGDITEFSGQERIFHKNKLVFYHNVIGGMIEE